MYKITITNTETGESHAVMTAAEAVVVTTPKRMNEYRNHNEMPFFTALLGSPKFLEQVIHGGALKELYAETMADIATKELPKFMRDSIKEFFKL